MKQRKNIVLSVVSLSSEVLQEVKVMLCNVEGFGFARWPCSRTAM